MRKLEALLHGAIGVSCLSGYLMYNRRHLLHFQKDKIKSKSQAVSVIIPARDEAQRIHRLLQSLTKQTVQAEVIVMDDDSQDETAKIAQQFGAQVYRVPSNKKGEKWYGKSYACYQGVKYTTSDILIFMDADVELLSHYALEAIIQTYAEQQYRGLLSVQPYHIVHKPYEQMSALFNLMTIVGMNTFSSVACKASQTLAFGPVTVMNQTDYTITQGHLNAQAHIIEGFALGQAFHQHQLPVTRYEGQGYVGFRMYEEGPKSFIEGWTKHLAVGATETQSRIMMLIIIWMLGIVTSTIAIITSLKVKSLSTRRLCVSYGLYTLQFIKLHRRVGRFSLMYLTVNPILFIVFILIFINSFRHIHLTKQVKWKGRIYTIN
ncbi:glycosyltransferase family 2 protein [Staphylococcus taiwanensis]|nr:glycosyltransferase family 2 protein [Staphylococcus taiwanensis]